MSSSGVKAKRTSALDRAAGKQVKELVLAERVVSEGQQLIAMAKDDRSFQTLTPGMLATCLGKVQSRLAPEKIEIYIACHDRESVEEMESAGDEEEMDSEGDEEELDSDGDCVVVITD